MNRYFKVLALLAAGAMILSAGVAGASVGSTSLPGASVAKKGCKKKGKKGADAAKKKRCKKKKKVTRPAVPSTVRATLTWTGPADLDLNAWDTGGTQGFVGGPAIANTVFSADDPDGGTETFTDLLSPSSRQFAYGVCTDAAFGAVTWSLTVRNSTGLIQTFTQADATLDSPGDNAVVTYTSPPSFVPTPDNGAGGWCP